MAAVAVLAGTRALCQTGAAEPALPPGQVIERVVCQHEPSQTYALFLPAAYRPDRQWPILYIFEPAARGPVAVRLFSAAAERLGYIVVASNNSHNGPSAIAIAAMEAMWLDTHRRFAIDARRIYTSGMSGGTAPAVWLATTQGAGIVSCAGPIQLSDVAKFDKTFTWLGVAGDADYNFDPNRDAVASLTKRGVPARFISFAGPHGWPPEEVATRSMEWLELGAMRTGRRAPDPAFVERMQQQGMAQARDLAAQGQLIAAAEENESLARELAGLAAVDAFEAEARRLRAMPEARREEKRIKALAAKYHSEAERLSRLRLRLEERAAGGATAEARAAGTIEGMAALSEAENASRDARQEIMRSLERLERDTETAADRETRLVARRVLRGFLSETYYAGQHCRRIRQFDAARVDSELHEAMVPKSPLPAYELARTAAARGDKKQALAELRRSLALGFADAWRLADDEEWKALADEPDFKAILDDLRSRSTH